MTPNYQTSLRRLAAGFSAADDAAWRALVAKALKGADPARLTSRTADGIEVAPLYTTRPDAAALLPGITARRWWIAQLRCETSPSVLATALAADIAGGADAATIRFAASGQSGLSPVVSDLRAALRGLDLGRFKLSFRPGDEAIGAMQAVADVLRDLGALSSLAGLAVDPLGVLATTGSDRMLKPDGPGWSMRFPDVGAALWLVADAVPYHEAGASEAQEIAALIGTLVAYLRWLEADGIAPADGLKRIALAMSADADMFLTLAKLRAARLLVARIAEACGVPAGSHLIEIEVTTSARMMARRDPWVNLLRTTSAAAAAAMGGADQITVLPHTWALGQPDALASRIARNAGLVLREEAGLGRIADPAGGAFAVEHLTRALAEKAWKIFQGWETHGGLYRTLKAGVVQDEIAAVVGARQKTIATRRSELTGVSAFPMLGDDGVSAEPWPTAAKLAPAGAFRRLVPIRLAAPFEALRDAADKAHKPLRVFLASLGTRAEHGARSLWIANVLASGGVGVIECEGFTASGEAARAYAQSGATVACICGTDETYAVLAEATAMALKSAGAAHVVLAGRPGSGADALKAAGVDSYLHAGIDVVAALSALQTRLGVPAV